MHSPKLIGVPSAQQMFSPRQWLLLACSLLGVVVHTVGAEQIISKGQLLWSVYGLIACYDREVSRMGEQ